MEGKQIFAFGASFVSILAGLLLNQFGIGARPYLGFGSVGTWLIWIGFIMLAVVLLNMSRSKRLVDERMLSAGSKASRIVFVLIIIAAFILMIADGIKPIQVPLGMFMAYLVNGMVFAYLVAYTLLLKYN